MVRRATSGFIDCRQTSQSKVRHQPQGKEPSVPQPMRIPPHPSIQPSIPPSAIVLAGVVEARAGRAMVGLRAPPSASCSDTDAGLAPMSPLGVVPVAITLAGALLCSPPAALCGRTLGLDGMLVPDGVTGPQADPLRDGSVLLLSSRELLLRPESLVALLESSVSKLSSVCLSRRIGAASEPGTPRRRSGHSRRSHRWGASRTA